VNVGPTLILADNIRWTPQRAVGRSTGYLLAILCVLGAATPIKSLQFLLPLVAAAILVWRREHRMCLRLAGWVAALIVISYSSMLIDVVRGRDVGVWGPIIAIFEYLPLLIVFCSDSSVGLEEGEDSRLFSLLIWFVIAEALIGWAQLAKTGNSDAVTGTFGLLSDVTIGQVYYTFGVFTVTAYIQIRARGLFAGIAVLLGLSACVIAQSGHQTVFALIALIVIVLCSLKDRRGLARQILAASALVGLVLYFYPETVDASMGWFEKVFIEPSSPKTLLIQAIGDQLSDPKNLLLGTGLGQFCSRAALILSGDYLANASLPTFMTAKSLYFSQQIEPLLYLHQEYGEGSAISQPYLSIATWLIEAGAVMCSMVAVVIAKEFMMLLRGMRSADRHAVAAARTLMFFLIFFLLCSFVENYAEFTPATMLPAVLYVLARSALVRPQHEPLSYDGGRASSRPRA
jgi:hypothetical protein